MSVTADCDAIDSNKAFYKNEWKGTDNIEEVEAEYFLLVDTLLTECLRGLINVCYTNTIAI